MNAQEQQMLQGLVERVKRAPLADKDADAEQMIQQTLGQNPDALYVLSQTVLVQGYALEQAQRQIADLRGQLNEARARAQEPKHTSSFLGNLLGRHEATPSAGAVPPPSVQTQYSSGGYGPGLAYPSGGYPIAGGSSAGGGFLQSALQTATGVAAGALAFEGIESLMHGFGHLTGYGPDYGGVAGGRSEEIVNNYYGDASPREHGGDISDRPMDSSQLRNEDSRQDGTLQDASYVTDGQGDEITDADDLSGTADTDYSSQGDDSMLSDTVGDDTGGDFGGGDSNSF